METADYGWTEEVEPNAVQPHDPAGPPTIGPRFNAVAGAGCNMSVTDLARFVIANMTSFRPESDEEVLGSEVVDQMHTRAENAPSHGLGFLVGDLDGIRFVAHTGGNLGWVAKIAFAPDLGEGIAIMMNGCVRAGLEFRETIEQTWRKSCWRQPSGSSSWSRQLLDRNTPMRTDTEPICFRLCSPPYAARVVRRRTLRSRHD